MDKHSALAERVEELLAPFDAFDRTKGRPPAEIASWLGLSESSTYRRIAGGEIKATKLAGAERRGGRGTAGRVLVSLVDAARFRAEHEAGGEAAEPVSEAASK